MNKMYIKLIVLTLFSIICLLFVYNDYFLYKTPILRVISVENKLDEDSIYGEDYFIQTITGILMNGEYKGKEITAHNTYSTSMIYDDKIEKHSELFVELSEDNETAVNIRSIKRDKYLVILLVIFIDLLIIIAGDKGIKTLASLLFNVILTTSAILIFMFYYLNINMLLLYIFVSILYIVGSLYITNGKSKKTLAAIVSSITALIVSFGISYLLIKIHEKDIYIWIMDYIEAVHDYYNYLYVCILLCGLGAIMDISITISSSLNELIVKNSKIDKISLLKSGKEISKDIVGTMINVMLFTCYTSIIPTVILAMRNGMNLANALSFYGGLELTIVLCTCIGIVLTIPISLYVSLLILSNRKGKENNE